jgi:U3 small nucleolar RNA-associated protein 14
MARRDEELRKRVEGRAVRKEFENESEDSFDDSDDDANDGDETAEQERFRKKLDQVSETPLMDPSLPGARLANMDFMRKADAARKKQNDATVEEMRRELAGEESGSEQKKVGDIGRRAFGPGTAAQEKKPKPAKSNEFEEPLGSDEEENEVQFHGLDNSSNGPTKTSPRKTAPSKGSSSSLQTTKVQSAPSEGGAWSKITSKSSTINEAEAKRRRHKKNHAVDIDDLDLSKAAVIASQPKPRKAGKKSTTPEVDSDDESNDENTVQLPFAIRDQELIKRAFAGADVVGEFEAEKQQIAEDEDDKVVDNTLPGWGSWVGDGVSKREKARNKGRFLTKVEGIKAQNRKDAKLERVIINEKRVKKVCLRLVYQRSMANSYCRTVNILLQVYRILSRRRCSTKDLCDCLSAQSGQRKRHSKMRPNRGSCLSKALSRLCQNPCCRFWNDAGCWWYSSTNNIIRPTFSWRRFLPDDSEVQHQK